MPDFVVTVTRSGEDSVGVKNVLVLDADNGWHAQVAAYMFVVHPLHPPGDPTEITCATGGQAPRGPLRIDARTNARIYNPDPYRDFPGQKDKLDDCDRSSEDLPGGTPGQNTGGGGDDHPAKNAPG